MPIDYSLFGHQIIDAPEAEVFETAAQERIDQDYGTPTPTGGRVMLDVLNEKGERRQLPLTVKHPPSAQPALPVHEQNSNEFDVGGWLRTPDFPLGLLWIVVRINQHTHVGYFVQSVPRTEQLDPWSFLTRPSPQELSPEDERILATLLLPVTKWKSILQPVRQGIQAHRTRTTNQILNWFRWERHIERPLTWQLCQYTDEDLPVQRNQLETLHAMLAELGLSLGMDLTRFRHRLSQPPKT